MFENMTYEYILKRALSNVPSDVDKRQGSVIYDAIAPCCAELAQLYIQLELLYAQTFLKTATGDALDLKGDERFVTRKQATGAEYGFTFKGTAPPLGTRFYSEEGYYFTLQQYETGTYYLMSVDTGTALNCILEGARAIPAETINGLESVAFGALYVPATDTETDEEYRQSIYDSIVPGENGNIQHYKNWCKEADEGVGFARIVPCANGPNTVKGIIIAADGSAASDELVAKVQAYVDPDDDDDGIGDGLGEGVANIGAHFIAVKPNEHAFKVKIGGLVAADGYKAADTIEPIKVAVTQMFKDIILSGDDTVSINSSEVGAVVQSLDCVKSYNTILILDNDTEGYKWNIGVNVIPVLSEVVLTP